MSGNFMDRGCLYIHYIHTYIHIGVPWHGRVTHVINIRGHWYYNQRSTLGGKLTPVYRITNIFKSAFKLKSAVFWNVMTCSIIDI
jgi:hypothetical protein